MRCVCVVTLALVTTIARAAAADPVEHGPAVPAADPVEHGPAVPAADPVEHGPAVPAAAPAVPAATPTAPAAAPADHGPGVSASRRAAAIGVAIFPGILVRGAGSWIVGEHRAAKRLAATGAIGAGALVVGGLPIAVSASNPYTIWPGVPLVVSGTGLFLSSWLADLWGAAGGAPQATPVALAPWSVEAATTWQHDAYRERALLGAAGHLELGRLGLDAGGYVDARNASRSGQVGARWQLWGPAATGRQVTDGSRVGVRAAARLDRDDDDQVTLATVEAEASGRLDLERLDPAIRGNFLELSAGGGLTRTSYPQGHHGRDAILLAGFAWGAYLGDRGELRLFYDHRRDGLAGGLAASRAAGFVGSVGTTAELRIRGPWAVLGRLQIGNAWVTTLGVRYLGGR